MCTLSVSGARRPKVALVLGGGGAKGAAEVGALKVIEQVGVPIDYIVGTSIGSIIGGLYSIGYRADDLDSLFVNQNWLKLFNDGRVHGQGRLHEVRGPGLMKGRGVIQFLDTLISRRPQAKALPGYPDSIDFNHLPIPYRAVACDINTGNTAVLASGSLSMSMRASMAIPGAFKPVRRDSLLMLDGGLVNNLPVDVARAMGADYVIAIDLTQNKHPDFKPKTIRKSMPKVTKWLRSRPDFVNYNRNRAQADVYINPTLKGYNVMSFKPKAIRAMIGLGEQAAKEKTSALKALKKKLLRR
jgi:NTE family protein